MTVLDEITTAIENYPATDVTISIADVAIHTGTGTSVNVNEIWKFRVRVENNGVNPDHRTNNERSDSLTV